jgi:hypothetical protein
MSIRHHFEQGSEMMNRGEAEAGQLVAEGHLAEKTPRTVENAN